MALRQRETKSFLSDEGPMLETLDYTIRIGSIPTFLYFDLYFFRLKVVYSHIQINAAKLTLKLCQDNNDRIDDHSRKLELDLLPLQDKQHIPTYLVQILDF